MPYIIYLYSSKLQFLKYLGKKEEFVLIFHFLFAHIFSNLS